MQTTRSMLDNVNHYGTFDAGDNTKHSLQKSLNLTLDSAENTSKKLCACCGGFRKAVKEIQGFRDQKLVRPIQIFFDLSHRSIRTSLHRKPSSYSNNTEVNVIFTWQSFSDSCRSCVHTFFVVVAVLLCNRSTIPN